MRWYVKCCKCFTKILTVVNHKLKDLITCRILGVAQNGLIIVSFILLTSSVV